MKRLILVLVAVFAITSAYSQSRHTVTYTETTTTNDTTVVVKEFHVVAPGGNTSVVFKKNESGSWINVNPFDINRSGEKRFNGHWAGIQLGLNGFTNEDYGSAYGVSPDFMDLSQVSSWEVGINFFDFSIPFTPKKNFGLVSGLGVSWHNYRFDNSITIAKDQNGVIQPVEIEENNYSKSKLMVTYLNLPLMLEYQFGGVTNRRMFVSAGMIAGLNIGSRTKVKNDGSKVKNRGSFSIESLKYSGIFQIGWNNLAFYTTYSFSELFKDGRGPELTPFSIGVSILNL